MIQSIKMTRIFWERWEVCIKCLKKRVAYEGSNLSFRGYFGKSLYLEALNEAERSFNGRLPWVPPLSQCDSCKYSLELIAVSGSAKKITPNESSATE